MGGHDVSVHVRQEAQEWFDSNPAAEKEDYTEKAQELEKVYIGARSKVSADGYASSSSEDGGEEASGGGPEGMGGAGEDEPSVEEAE